MVQSSINWTLGGFVEKLTLTGSAAINGTGNTLGNVMTGNGAANILQGGIGNDTLVGGAGADVFAYASVVEGGDTITDFVQGTDKLRFLSSNFGNLSLNQLQAGRFVSNGSGVASGAGAQFIFNTANGVLKYDADGTGSAAAVTIATLNVRNLASSDFTFLTS